MAKRTTRRKSRMRQRGGQTTTRDFSSVLPFVDASKIPTEFPPVKFMNNVPAIVAVFPNWDDSVDMGFYDDESYFAKTYMSRLYDMISFTRSCMLKFDENAIKKRDLCLSRGIKKKILDAADNLIN